MEVIYILSVLVESNEEIASVEITPYRKIEDALKAYSEAFDEAMKEAETYQKVCVEDEVATDRYRWFRVADEENAAAITIELDAKVIHEEYIQGE